MDVNDNNFEKVITNNNLLLIEFWATWCGPCRVLSSFIDKLADNYSSKLLIAKANVEDCENTANSLNVQNLPCVIFFKDGKEINRVIGNNQAKIREIVESL